MEGLLLLAGAGLLAGAMNALAGGGSFVSLPALIAVGVPSVAANASSTVALYPGGLASAWVYRTGLSDICGVDHYPETPRFEAVYHLYSLPNRWRVRIKCRLGDPPEVPSVTGVWRTANWHEREAWDMYGIRFLGHPDLRRIYMWEGFEGFPQRKDFPLRGYKDKLNPFGAEGPPPTQPDLATRDIP